MTLNTRKRKHIFYSIVIINFIAILIYNILTPLMSDDLLFNPVRPYTLWDLLKEEYNNYMTWNGRSVVQFIMHVFLLFPKGVFNIFNSCCFILLTFLIYWNINEKKEYDFTTYTLITLMLWQFGISFDQTILWLSGACNYLWGTVIILGFVTFFRYKTENPNSIRHETLLTIGLFFFGLLAGWCNENTSGGGLLLVLFFAIVDIYNNKKIKPWIITGILGNCIGLLFMVMAPGNSVRGALNKTEESHDGILGLIGRFLKINAAIEQHLFPMLVVIIILMVYIILKNKNIKLLIKPLLFIVVALATSYVLIFTPQPMDRAYFGAGIFVTIAFIQMIVLVPQKDLYLSTVKYGGIIVFVIFMFFSYCENGSDLVRILREVNEREEYILDQKELGTTTITLPKLRPDFQTQYSFMYMNDVNEDPDYWGNWLYEIYYGFDDVLGIPREEWTEY